MRIGIVYCETLKSEVLELSKMFPQVCHLKEMPWELHIEPEKLLAEICLQIEDIQGHVDAIVLGYGRCQCLDQLEDSYKVPVLRPEAEDCIGVLLGQKRYEDELKKNPGTWFLSPGWTRMGIEFVFHELQLSRVDSERIEPLKLARRMLDGFSRALYIKIPFCNEIEELWPRAQKISDSLELRLEETEGSLAMLEKVIWQALDSGRKSACLDE